MHLLSLLYPCVLEGARIHDFMMTDLSSEVNLLLEIKGKRLNGLFHLIFADFLTSVRICFVLASVAIRTISNCSFLKSWLNHEHFLSPFTMLCLCRSL